MGVTRENGKYRARYTFRGTRYNVGSFDTRGEAELALHQHQWENSKMPSFEWEQTPEPANKLNKRKPTLFERVKNAINDYRANTK